MNIFILDKDIKLAAQAHLDKHCSKMILETAQLLSTAVNTISNERHPELYKTSHLNHPCAIWARLCRENFEWLCDLGFALDEEFQYRFGKQHKSALVIKKAFLYNHYFRSERQLTPFAQAMPDDCKNKYDAVAAYRKYYREHKKHLLVYTKRLPPEWCADISIYKEV